MFDKSHLPPAQFEFVVISDTHYMRDVGDRPLEFESRRKQTPRAEVALKQVAALHPDFVVHLGDLAQEYPESPDFPHALEEALHQLRACNVQPYHVAGNQDVGDKRDATMPTHPASAASLAFYHTHIGPSWYSFDRGECHIIVLNALILNADLPETRTQWAWLEKDLQTSTDARILIFLHLPPYLWNADEPGLGHYDNISPPDRNRLLDLVRNHNVELLAAGHVHYPFYDRIGTTRYLVLPSPSFTRPGFGHLFASAAPPEQGRDDTGKLGFYLMRVFPDRIDAHLIRTGGALALPERTRLITCTSAGLPASPIGVTLRHPLTPSGEVPIAWPSVVRQRVRNDLPHLACLELGAASVRVPHRDLSDPFQRTRLAHLHRDGLRIVATVLAPHLDNLPEQMRPHTDLVDLWEIQLPGGALPTPEQCATLKTCTRLAPLSLCPIVPNERVPGKQHLRTRIGYRPEDLDELNAHLSRADLPICRALCRISPDASPWTWIHTFGKHPPLSHIAHLDLSLELLARDDRQNASRAAEACMAIAAHPGMRLFVDPLTDLDRTMDVMHGLLDTLCNPRPPFHVIRCLNTLLFGPHAERENLHHTQTETDTYRACFLHTTHQTRCLLLPKSPTAPISLSPLFPTAKTLQIHTLATAEIATTFPTTPLPPTSYPLLLIPDPLSST